MGYDKAKVESAKLTEETLKLANMLVNAKWRLHEVETQELDTTAVTLEFIDSLEWMEIHFRRYYLPEAPIEEEDSLGGK